MAIGYRVWSRLHSEEEMTLTGTVALRRMVARCVLTRAENRGLLAFRACGPDLRLLLVGGRDDARELAHRTKLAILRRLRAHPCTFGPTKIDAIVEQWHLQNAFGAMLRRTDPADTHHEASNLPDLLGLRLIGGYTARNVRCHLPRIKRERLLEWFGQADVRPDVSLDDLADSAAAAICRETLTGNSEDRVAARVALAEVVGDRLGSRQLARLAGMGERTVRRLRALPADVDLVRAIQLQMGCRRRGGAAEPPVQRYFAAKTWTKLCAACSVVGVPPAAATRNRSSLSAVVPPP
jgi:hypothetical protein